MSQASSESMFLLRLHYQRMVEYRLEPCELLGAAPIGPLQRMYPPQRWQRGIIIIVIIIIIIIIWINGRKGRELTCVESEIHHTKWKYRWRESNQGSPTYPLLITRAYQH